MLGYEILKKLEKEEVLSSKDLAKALDVKPSRIRREIDYLNGEMDESVAYISKKRGQGNGYSLVVTDAEEYRLFCENLQNGKYDIFYPDDRVETIILKFLSATEPIKSEDLSEELFVSSRQLNNDLKNVRAILNDFSLSIKNIPYHGMVCEGEEFNKRLCLANLYFKNIFNTGRQNRRSIFEKAEIRDEFEKIKKIVLEESAKYQIQFSDTSLENLVIHLFVILRRSSRSGKEKTGEISYINENEIELSNAIMSRIEREFNVSFSEYDYQCVEIHVAGKRAYLENDVSLIGEEVKVLTNEILERVDEDYKTDYKNNEDLKVRLHLHLAPLLIRIKNNIVSRNAIIEDIKSKYTLSYEQACLAGQVIEEKYGHILAEDEICYIALHFELSFYQTKLKKYKVLLICYSGGVSSQILKNRMLSQYGNYIKSLDVCGVNQISRYDLERYTFIFSTIPVTAFTSTPIYVIDNFLDKSNKEFITNIFEMGDFSVERAKKFFPKELFLGEQDYSSKEEAITKMVEIIGKHRKISDSFLDEIMEREKIAPTDYGNQVAIPHPIHMTTDGMTYTGVCILKKAIKWGNNQVRVVLLNSISKGTGDLQQYYYLVTALITDEKKIENLIKNPDYDTFIKLVTK